jgi:hypothetical protein
MATPALRTSAIAPGVRWNPRLRRYIDGRGRIVSQATVRRITEDQVADARVRMRALGESLVSGRISLAEWQLGMEAQVKRAHIAAASAARGGFAQLNQSDLGWIGARVREQYGFLRNFAREIETGRAPLDGRILSRSDLYGSAARGSGREMERRIERIAGAAFERRVLGPADHCRTCIQQARLGWQPLGRLKRIGDSECRVNCRCHFEAKRRKRA